MNDILKRKIDNLPTNSGCYVYKNKDNEVIYVGKAKNLKNRVRSYFQAENSRTKKVKALVQNIADVEYTITDTETEALMLECNMIKEYRPRYNILLKDDKTYPSIMITIKDDFPMLICTRRRKNDSNKYYGPFTSVLDVKKTLEAMNRYFPLKDCSKTIRVDTPPSKVCLNYHMHRCDGVCTKEVDKYEYRKRIDEIIAILDNKAQPLIDRLREDMYEQSDKLNFELAGYLKELLTHVQQLFENQKITTDSFDERDIISVASDERSACIQIFNVREGKIVKSTNHYLTQEDENKSDILSSFITQYYTQGRYIPKEILIEQELSEMDLTKSLLSELRGAKCDILIPQKGDKKRLVELATKNAQMNIDIIKTKEEKRLKEKKNAHSEIEKILGMDKKIHRIESVDISNISGSENVGVVVAFEDGERNAKALRKFRVKYVVGQDDYASMAEVLFRRLQRAYDEIHSGTDSPKFLPLPELILVDGGYNHINAVKNIVDSFNYDITVAGLIKDNKHKLRGLITEQKKEIKCKDLIYSKKLLNDISEEVHRSAIGYHKLSRTKALLRTELENIPQISEKRAMKLLAHFKDIEKIKSASIEELREVDGMNILGAKSLYEYFHNNGNC